MYPWNALNMLPPPSFPQHTFWAARPVKPCAEHGQRRLGRCNTDTHSRVPNPGACCPSISEIATIWTGKWTTLKVLYLLVRYIPFLSFTDLFMTFSPDYESKFCMAFFQFNMWTSTIGLVMAEACFFLRAYALWGTSRGVAIFLVGLFTTMIVVGFTVEGIVSASASSTIPQQAYLRAPP
ncbi:hypothetical protein D9756_009222 [Leucocoprinus leucothites]|uniref:Uncharacterized protein n=1 Tax=Leucocoprinus leucothites TaxID=201217 RepID=A0A8H5FV99_9AGAR|nr:hypothetical protein D9756_009222 [Leucoagaricus leucothites]